MREILFRGQTRRYGEKVRTLKEQKQCLNLQYYTEMKYLQSY